jgi:hypothetical protein
MALTQEQVSKVEAIAKLLGAAPDDWRADVEDRTNPRIVRTSGAHAGAWFWLSFGGFQKAGRISVHCGWPKNREGQEPYPTFFRSWQGDSAPSITIADTKSAELIARDIVRRFLPAWLPLWEKQVAYLAEVNQMFDAREANMVAFAKAIGGSVWRDQHDPDRKEVRVPELPGRRSIYKVTVDQRGIDMDVRGLTVDQAVAIFNMLKGQASDDGD